MTPLPLVDDEETRAAARAALDLSGKAGLFAFVDSLRAPVRCPQLYCGRRCPVCRGASVIFQAGVDFDLATATHLSPFDHAVERVRRAQRNGDTVDTLYAEVVRAAVVHLPGAVCAPKGGDG